MARPPCAGRDAASVRRLSGGPDLGTSPGRRESLLQILAHRGRRLRDADRGRSDTMVLVQADPAAGSVRALSFLRDLYVAIPGCGTTRLNAAYSFGGEKLLKTTLKNNFGVEIDRTVTVSFDSLCHIVDALGGVELEVTEAEREQLNGILAAYNRGLKLNPSDGRLKQSGRVRLSGKQALSYSRIRKMDSDFQRAGRQQKVLAAMLESAKQMNFFTLARLAWTCLREVRTDPDAWRPERPFAAGHRRRGNRHRHGSCAL